MRKGSYICKRFDGKQWIWLGVVYADSLSEACELARAKWGRVDSVFGDIVDSLPDAW